MAVKSVVKKEIPFDFVLEELAKLRPYTKPMFGCTSVYVGDKIVFILRKKTDFAVDNGVWLATTQEHHESLKKDFPIMRSIKVFSEGGPTGWQVLPDDHTDFEEAVNKACELVRLGDPRIGKIPKSKLKNAGKAALKKNPAVKTKSSPKSAKISKARIK